jgi:hypothetical protein
MVECDGEFVSVPFDGNWIVPTLEGRLPNKVLLDMDADRFKRGFEARAVWTHGKGEFATLAYCGHGLTIQRHQTLAKAVEAKKVIDSSGCGGGCAKVHLIVHVDPANPRADRQKANVRQHVAAKKNESAPLT